MTSRNKEKAVKHEIYPRRYFDASPTWFIWNKLTAQGVQNLRQEPGFEGQKVYFHLNHPVQFVSLTGLAIQIELGGGTSATKYCFITLDDGSGKVINIKITRRSQEELEMQYPSSTTVDELDVEVRFGLPTLFINKKELSLGQCIRVRGTLDTFRDKRQLELKRIKTVDTTADEISSWIEAAQWKRDVLDRPWILTDADQKDLDAKLEAERARLADRRIAKIAWHARQAQKQSAADRKAAAKLARLEIEYNDGALSGSHFIKAPWD